MNDKNASNKASKIYDRHAIERMFIRATKSHDVDWTLEDLAGMVSRARSGAVEAYHELALTTVRYVVKIAKSYRGRMSYSIDLGDLCSVGYLGAYHAATKYEPGKGFLFSTYATSWIHQFILRYLAYAGRTVNVPIKQLDEVKKLRIAIEKLSNELGRTPRLAEIARAFGTSIEEVDDLRTFGESNLSLLWGDGVSSEEDNSLAYDVAVRVESPSVDLVIDRSRASAKFNEALDALPDGERKIITLLYGLEDEPLKAPAIARMLGTNDRAVRYTASKALKTLRNSLCKEEQFAALN